MSEPQVYLFVDNSNIFISSKGVADRREGRFARDAVRLEFERLIQLSLAGRTLAQAFVVGSIPPEHRAVWDRLAEKTGIKPELYERGGLSGGEQGLDQCLQVHMLRALHDNDHPQIAVLLTGDGAGYDDGVGFHADIARLHAAGWGIEVLSWEQSCRKSLRTWATTNGCFVSLDEHYESITFLEGTRRPASLNLTKRPRASVRQSPAQLAAERAKNAAEQEVARLQAELDTMKAARAKKDAARERFLKRQASNSARRAK